MRLLTCLQLLNLALCTVPLVFAQQYVGEVINHTMRSTAGAEVTFWNIRDSQRRDTTLLNYFSLPTTTGKRQDSSKVQRLLIIIPTRMEEAFIYFNAGLTSLRNAEKINPAVSEETVAILVPIFPEFEAGKDTTYPFVNATSPPSALVWNGIQWVDGAENVYPTDQRTVSSFDVLDQVLQYFDNRIFYPNLKQIVVSGHSRGGQMIHRYAAVGKDIPWKAPVTYWVGNPSSFLWLNKERPLSTADCPTFDDWMFGLSNYTNLYENAVVKANPTTGVINARYKKRNIAYARGLNDNGDASGGLCAPWKTGSGRGERFLNFLTAFPPGSGDTVDYYPNIGHNGDAMISHEPGVYRLILDNFNGNGSRRADFGPRQLQGGVDNPHPVE